MTESTPERSKALAEEILQEAHHQAQELLDQARTKAQGLLQEAQRQADELKRDRIRKAEADAASQREAILASVPVILNRFHATQVEALLDRIQEQACARLRDVPLQSGRNVLAVLASDALHAMTGERFSLRLPTAEFGELSPGLAEAIQARVGRPLCIAVQPDGTASPGQWVLQDEEGHQFWELGLITRLQRLWPDLRRQIASVEQLGVRT